MNVPSLQSTLNTDVAMLLGISGYLGDESRLMPCRLHRWNFITIDLRNK